jgi:hypothetical protein
MVTAMRTLSVTQMRVFENLVLRRIFGPRREEVTGRWRHLHIDECHNLYSLPNIIRAIKSWWIRWARHAACMCDMRIYSLQNFSFRT